MAITTKSTTKLDKEGAEKAIAMAKEKGPLTDDKRNDLLPEDAATTKSTSKLNKEGAEKAIAMAKERGSLTYDELNDLLPEDATSEDMDELMVKLGSMDIEIIDELRVDAETQQIMEKKRKAGQAGGSAPRSRPNPPRARG